MMTTWQESFEAGGTNPRLGSRFTADGQFLAEHGNTVVAQVTAGSATEAALIGLRRALMALPFADHFAFTAIQSYHMMVFEGVIETRRARGYWPDDLPPDASIDTMTQAISAKLAGFTPPPPFRMRLVEVTPLGLHLTGATDQDEANVRAWRDALAGALGFRTTSHDAYGFHSMMAYQKRWPPAKSLGLYEQALAQMGADFAARVPVLDLDPPPFVAFQILTPFRPCCGLWGPRGAYRQALRKIGRFLTERGWGIMPRFHPSFSKSVIYDPLSSCPLPRPRTARQCRCAV